jgi:hypothetical protein
MSLSLWAGSLWWVLASAWLLLLARSQAGSLPPSSAAGRVAGCAACVCSGRRPCWRLTATLAAPPTTQRRDVSLMTITNTAAGLLLPRRGGPSALL